MLSPLSSETKNLGIIEVTFPEYKDPGRTVRTYVLFHIEDVYDKNGNLFIQERIYRSLFNVFTLYII